MFRAVFGGSREGFSHDFAPMKHVLKGCSAICAGLLATVVLAASARGAVTLGNVARVGNQLQFTVTGESNVIYIIEGSTNLQQWSAVSTNRESGLVRNVAIHVSASRGYYRARPARLFTGALVAKDFIDLQGNNIQVDSFDSADPNYSTAGRYDPTKRRDSGDVAAYSGLTNSLNVGNALIYGKLTIGPGGSATIGPSGCVGSLAYVSNPSNAGTIQPGWLRDDLTEFLPDATLPLLSPSFSPTPGTVGGTNYTYVLGNDNYRMTSLSMSSGTMLVTGRTRLHVSGNISISGTGKIVIGPTGSLTLYAGTPAGTNSAAVNIGGSGIINQTHRASNFQYYGLRRNTTLRMTGNGTFAGTIYAPNTDFEFYAGGSSAEDFSGSIVSKTMTLNGHVRVHYDEDLARSGPVF